MLGRSNLPEHLDIGDKELNRTESAVAGAES
jgi:hypothetical protein